MCAQIDVLKKIRKAGKMNGFATELAEAQAKDYVSFRREFKDFAESVKEWQIKQDAQMELVVKYINSPADQDKIQGAYWRALATVTKSKIFWLFVVAMLFFVAMTGSEIKHLLGWLPIGA